MSQQTTIHRGAGLRINPADYPSIVFFTGAGMSAESGVETYRGKGGGWHEYDWESYACQRAFERDPEKVLDFHELRRRSVLDCDPHAGHTVITQLQQQHSGVSVITQNIDGMHQRAGSHNVIELHGSLWRMRCSEHGITEDTEASYRHRRCPQCQQWLRPDITWFEDMLNEQVMHQALETIQRCDLFISIGTSGVVYPAAGFPKLAYDCGARMLCINIEAPADDRIFDDVIIAPAAECLATLFSTP